MDGDLRGAAEDLGHALQQVAELGSTNDHVVISMRLADLKLRAGQPDEARRLAESMAAGRGYGPGEFLPRLMSTIVRASIAMYEDDEPAMRRAYDDLTALLASMGEPTQFMAHGGAVAEAVVALLALRLGWLERARDHLGASHEQALLTQDRPIMAMAAVAVAHWLQALGSAADAARMLGIGARLRGSDDHTSLLIAALTEKLRAELGAGFDRQYTEGAALDPDDAVSMVDPARYDTSPAGALTR
jgi:hypothetical protein